MLVFCIAADNGFPNLKNFDKYAQRTSLDAQKRDEYSGCS